MAGLSMIHSSNAFPNAMFRKDSATSQASSAAAEPYTPPIGRVRELSMQIDSV